MRETRYWVKRQECWGGIYVFGVWDSTTRAFVGNMTTERTAKRRRDKLNRDLEDFHRRLLSATASPRSPRLRVQNHA